MRSVPAETAPQQAERHDGGLAFFEFPPLKSVPNMLKKVPRKTPIRVKKKDKWVLGPAWGLPGETLGTRSRPSEKKALKNDFLGLSPPRGSPFWHLFRENGKNNAILDGFVRGLVFSMPFLEKIIEKGTTPDPYNGAKP